VCVRTDCNAGTCEQQVWQCSAARERPSVPQTCAQVTLAIRDTDGQIRFVRDILAGGWRHPNCVRCKGISRLGMTLAVLRDPCNIPVHTADSEPCQAWRDVGTGRIVMPRPGGSRWCVSSAVRPVPDSSTHWLQTSVSIKRQASDCVT
jgi:hypothetical protein